MEPPIGHIQIAVGDLALVEPFSDRLIPLPGDRPGRTSTGYYAFFFRDPDGIKLEVVHHSGRDPA